MTSTVARTGLRALHEQQPAIQEHVWVLGFEPAVASQLTRLLEGTGVRVLTEIAGRQAPLGETPAVAICFGPSANRDDVEQMLNQLSSEARALPPVIVTGAQSSAAHSDAYGEVFYRSPGALCASDLVQVIHAARAQSVPVIPTPQDTRLQALLDALDTDLATCRDLASGSAALTRALCSALQAEHAELWIEIPRGGQLRATPGAGTQRLAALDRGLVGFAACIESEVRLAAPHTDPRFDRATDAAPGAPAVAEPGPILLHGCGRIGERILVAAAHREAADEPFDDAASRLMDALLGTARTHLRRWIRADNASNALVRGPHDLYRAEALDSYLEDAPTEGDLLRADPGWTRLTYRVLLAFVGLALLFCLLAQINEYAEGPAVVHFGDRAEIFARHEGTVQSILVKPDQQVAAGDLLLRFHSPNEAAEVLRLEQEFALRLRQRLRALSDPDAEQELISARTHLELARAKLEEFEVRAPRQGVVSDIRIRPGAHLPAGEPILTLVSDHEALAVLVFLPGQARPALAPGQELRLELAGYPGVHHDLVIESVDREIIGPAQARRALGSRISDAVQLEGPVVIATAILNSATFEADGKTLTLHDGMYGQAEVITRSRSLLLHLIPGLETLFQGHSHG